MKKIGNYVFFWGGFLSQWEPSPFIDATGLPYTCAEQYMMAAKARLMKDADTLEKIMNTTDPREQKKLGRSINNFNAELWDAHKVNVVITGNLLKFIQNESFRNCLMKYSDEIFVEASPYDKVWGIGRHVDDITNATFTPEFWKGQNLLGYSLTVVRDRIKSQYSYSILPKYFIDLMTLKRDSEL